RAASCAQRRQGDACVGVLVRSLSSRARMTANDAGRRCAHGIITADALRGVPLFSALPPATLDHVAGAVEDIRLVAGEYFAQEGDERALLVVIEGRAEITKVVNGD